MTDNARGEHLSEAEMAELWKQTFVLKEEYDKLQAQLDAERGRVAMLEAAVKHALPYINIDRCVSCGDERGYTCYHCEPLVNALQATAADWLAGVKAEAVMSERERCKRIVQLKRGGIRREEPGAQETWDMLGAVLDEMEAQ